MRGEISGRGKRAGGIIGYPSERLQEEVAYIAYHFHWSHEQILALEHRERQLWVQEIAKINRRLNDELKGEVEQYGG
jgi:hypothetical protein